MTVTIKNPFRTELESCSEGISFFPRNEIQSSSKETPVLLEQNSIPFRGKLIFLSKKNLRRT